MYDPGVRGGALGGIGAAGGALALTGFSAVFFVFVAALCVVSGFVLLRMASRRRSNVRSR